MFLLIEGGDVYGPEPMGAQSLLIGNDKVWKVGSINAGKLASVDLPIRTVDAGGCYVVPGLVDPHAHLIGAAGEQGFGTRTPEMRFDQIVSAGITTIVGTIGTDIVCRRLETLLSKVRLLESLGITARMYTGGFGVPPETLTGSLKRDLVLIGEVIGTGELAISDPRSSAPALDDLARIVHDSAVGGMIAGKAGVTHFHVGEAPSRLSLLHALLDHHAVNPGSLYPTHITRTPELMDDAIALARRGSPVDTDCVEESTGRWARTYRERGGPPGLLTLSSDAQTIGGAPFKFYETFVSCVLEYGMKLEEALAHFTTNASDILKLAGKGRIRRGADADLLVLEKNGLEIRHVIARGRVVVEDGRIIVPSEQDPSRMERSQSRSDA